MVPGEQRRTGHCMVSCMYGTLDWQRLSCCIIIAARRAHNDVLYTIHQEGQESCSQQEGDIIPCCIHLNLHPPSH